MELVPVSSSNIEAVGYDASTLVMVIQFKGERGKPGGRYKFLGVLPKHHADLMAAKSVGSHFHAHIKGKYQTEKIG